MFTCKRKRIPERLYNFVFDVCWKQPKYLYCYYLKSHTCLVDFLRSIINCPSSLVTATWCRLGQSEYLQTHEDFVKYWDLDIINSRELKSPFCTKQIKVKKAVLNDYFQSNYSSHWLLLDSPIRSMFQRPSLLDELSVTVDVRLILKRKKCLVILVIKIKFPYL